MDLSKMADLVGKALKDGPKPGPEVCAGEGCVKIVYPDLAAYSARTSRDMDLVAKIKDLAVESSEVDEPALPSDPRVVRVRFLSA